MSLFHGHKQELNQNIWNKVFKIVPKWNLWNTAFEKFEVKWSIEIDHMISNFLKVVFQKVYLVYSWALCSIWPLLKSGSSIRNAAVVYPRLPQTSEMKRFATIAKCQKSFALVTKLSILDMCGNPEYAFGVRNFFLEYYKITCLMNLILLCLRFVRKGLKLYTFKSFFLIAVKHHCSEICMFYRS